MLLYNNTILMTEDKQHVWKLVYDKWEALPTVPDELKEETIPKLSHYISLTRNNNPFHYLLKQYYLDEEVYKYRARQYGLYGGMGYAIFAIVFPTTDGRFTYIIESFERSEKEFPAPWKTIVQTFECLPRDYKIHWEMYCAFLSVIEATSPDKDEVNEVDEDTFRDSIQLGKEYLDEE